jgi:hypothetical protein
MRSLVAALLLGLPTLASAQTIYKVQTPDGSILFTDAPPPGSKVLEERSGRPAPRVSGNAPAGVPPRGVPTMSGPGAPPGVPLPPGARVSTSPPPGAADPAAAAMQEVTAAEAALAVSKRRLELGREPLPGERRGLAGGGSRLTEEYEQRIAGLERDVADAEARLQRAYAARNTGR